MQISTASLLAAQQQMPSPKTAAQPSAFGAFLNTSAPEQAKEAAKPAFEPVQFVRATPATPKEPAAARADMPPAMGFRAPGSTLDIRI